MEPAVMALLPSGLLPRVVLVVLLLLPSDGNPFIEESVRSLKLHGLELYLPCAGLDKSYAQGLHRPCTGHRPRTKLPTGHVQSYAQATCQATQAPGYAHAYGC